MFPIKQENALHAYRDKKCMLQPSDNNNRIEEPADKANIQYFFHLNCKSEYIMYPVEWVLCEIKKWHLM